ncbi:MAG TPA: hypothetical protein VGQ81_10810 [Acidobacteriota bacterium]|jgi:hypothetical protein|nr:hypothetical protein [Acidobacteriota bacterium]
MEAVVGIFPARADAERAAEQLRSIGLEKENVNLLLPGAGAEELAAVPTVEGEQPGMGRAVGSVVGGALGAAAGLPVGAVAAGSFVPGVGPVIAVGMIAAGLVGAAAGAVGGGATGEAVEDFLAKGLPVDELFIYEDALRKGRAVVIVLAQDGEQATQTRELFMKAGAEELDSAREAWWLGLRDVEEEKYTAQGRDFRRDETAYRRGFEAALQLRIRGKSYDGALEYLRHHYPDVYRDESFRHGYDRGQAHFRELKRTYRS